MTNTLEKWLGVPFETSQHNSLKCFHISEDNRKIIFKFFANEDGFTVSFGGKKYHFNETSKDIVKICFYKFRSHQVNDGYAASLLPSASLESITGALKESGQLHTGETVEKIISKPFVGSASDYENGLLFISEEGNSCIYINPLKGEFDVMDEIVDIIDVDNNETIIETPADARRFAFDHKVVKKASVLSLLGKRSPEALFALANNELRKLAS